MWLKMILLMSPFQKVGKMIFNAFLPLISQLADEVIENQRSL
jgi:hypothetical protein